MTTARDDHAVIEEIVQERERQQHTEGWTLEHDDRHSVAQWMMLLTRYLGRACEEAEIQNGDGYRRRLVQVAAIAAAAVESYDRATALYSPEHYLDG